MYILAQLDTCFRLVCVLANVHGRSTGLIHLSDAFRCWKASPRDPFLGGHHVVVGNVWPTVVWKLTDSQLCQYFTFHYYTDSFCSRSKTEGLHCPKIMFFFNNGLKMKMVRPVWGSNSMMKWKQLHVVDGCFQHVACKKAVAGCMICLLPSPVESISFCYPAFEKLCFQCAILLRVRQLGHI